MIYRYWYRYYLYNFIAITNWNVDTNGYINYEFSNVVLSVMIEKNEQIN